MIKEPLHIKNMCDFTCNECPDWHKCKDLKIKKFKK